MNWIRGVLALLYSGIVSLRGWLYDRGIIKSYSSSLPVISVGNVTAGGNGKTPLCLALAVELQRRGYTPAILSRGYGGRCRGPHRVTQSDGCRDVGDEAILMAQSGVPVFVARRRVEGVKLIELDAQIDVVILDDGFQHRALARVLDIVSIFVGSPQAIDQFEAGKVLPLGMFREQRDKALQRADIVVLSYRSVPQPTQSKELENRVCALLPGSADVFRSFLSVSGVVSLGGNRTVQPGKVCALAAIANPEGFFLSLESLGFSLVERIVFPDHHLFSEVEIRRYLVEYSDVMFVCTAKDAVKLRELSAEIQERFAVLSVVAHLEPEETFFQRIVRAIEEHRAESVQASGLVS